METTGCDSTADSGDSEGLDRSDTTRGKEQSREKIWEGVREAIGGEGNQNNGED